MEHRLCSAQWATDSHKNRFKRHRTPYGRCFWRLQQQIRGKWWYFGSPPDILGEWQGWCPASSPVGGILRFFEGKRGVSSYHYTVWVERAELEENMATNAAKASKQRMGIWNGTQEPGTFPCSKENSGWIHWSSWLIISLNPKWARRAKPGPGQSVPSLSHNQMSSLSPKLTVWVTLTWSREHRIGRSSFA